MSLAELNDAECLALVGLAKVLVRADGVFSDEEKAALGRLGAEVGAEKWTRALKAAAETLRSNEALDAAVAEVERPEAREAIHQALEGLADSDDVSGPEASVLDKVARLWDLGSEAPLAPKFLQNP